MLWLGENFQEVIFQRGVDRGFLFAPGCDTENLTSVLMVCSSFAAAALLCEADSENAFWDLAVSVWMTLENTDFCGESKDPGLWDGIWSQRLQQTPLLSP